MCAKKKEKQHLLNFRGRPLVRCGDVIYYGDINDRFIIELTIKSSTQVKDMKVAQKVAVRLVDSAYLSDRNKKTIKMSEKNGLFNAIDIASVWLERAKEFQMHGIP